MHGLWVFAPKPQGNASLATQATIGYLSTTPTFNMADSPYNDSCLNLSTTTTSLLLFKPLYNGHFLLSPSWPLWRGSTVCERGINFNGRLGCVAGAWKKWAKERTGAREGDTRGVRVSPSRAPVFSCAHYFQAPATQANGRYIKGILFSARMVR